MTQQLSVFLNSFCFMVTGMVAIILVMDTLFPRRHSLGVFIVYTLVKGLLWSWYDVSYFLGTIGQIEYAFQMLAPAIFGVLSFVVLYYTWEGSFAKIGLGSFCLDSAFSCLTLGVLYLAHGWLGTASAIDNRGYLGVGTAFSCAACLALVAAVLRLMRPITAWFRGLKLVHEKAWLALVVAAIVVSSVARMLSVEQVQTPALIASLGLVSVLACLGVFLVGRIQLGRKRKRLLVSEAELARTYDRSIREQLAYLQESKLQLDRMAIDVVRLQAGVSDASLGEYVAQLREACDALRTGSYSNCPALDVVLSTSGEALERLGYRVEYRVPPLGDAAVEVALVAQTMLAWVEQACSVGGAKPAMAGLTSARRCGKRGVPPVSGGSEDTADGCVAKRADIALRIVRRNGQLAFILRMPSSRMHFPRSLIKDRVIEFDGVLFETDDGACKTVRALIAEAG